MTPPRPPDPRTRLVLAPALLFLAASLASADDPPAPPPPAPLPGAVDAKPAAGPAAAVGEHGEWRTGDTIDVKVLSRADLSCTVAVLADGTIDVPFSGRFRAVGRALADMRAEVEAGFAKYERSPQVALTVASLSPDQFFVLGEVGKAGVYTVPRTKHASFLQALGMAGGFGPEADFTKVQILPAGGGKPRTVDASPARLALLAAVFIADGDTISVPSVGRIYVMGQVGRTGGFAPPPGERLTLSRAIALAGGITRLGNSRSVTVTWRNVAGEPQSATYDVQSILLGGAPDVEVFAGNLIYVPERLF